MKLYDRQGTPNFARIRIVLATRNLDDAVEIIQVDLVGAEQKQDWFLALNPIGKTPVLILDDGLALSESPAITEYLDNLDGNPIRTGVTPREELHSHDATPGRDHAARPSRRLFPLWHGGPRRSAAALAHAGLGCDAEERMRRASRGTGGCEPPIS